MVELLVLKYPRIKLFINLEEGMANKNGSNKQSLIIYVFVSIVIMMMFWIGDDIIKVNTFDDKIDQGSIVINNVAIPIGTASVTSPAHTSILDIPSVNGEGLTDQSQSLEPRYLYRGPSQGRCYHPLCRCSQRRR